MLQRPPRSTRTDSLFPYTTLFRAGVVGGGTASSPNLRMITCSRRVALFTHQRYCRSFHSYRASAISALLNVADCVSLILAAALSKSEEHTSELQSLMRISYAVFCLKKKN